MAWNLEWFPGGAPSASIEDQEAQIETVAGVWRHGLRCRAWENVPAWRWGLRGWPDLGLRMPGAWPAVPEDETGPLIAGGRADGSLGFSFFQG